PDGNKRTARDRVAEAKDFLGQRRRSCGRGGRSLETAVQPARPLPSPPAQSAFNRSAPRFASAMANFLVSAAFAALCTAIESHWTSPDLSFSSAVPRLL